MASEKISALPAASAASLTDLLAKVNDPSGTPITQKLTVTQLKTLFDTFYAALGGGFASVETAFSNLVTLYTFAHGLGAKPSSFSAVMVNQTTDLGYAAGMEVDVRFAFGSTSGTAFWSVYVDATNVYVSVREALPTGGTSIRLTLAAGGVPLAGPDYTKWKLKVYART